MTKMLRRGRTAASVVRALGTDWAVNRAGHEFRLKSGLIKRRLPLLAWDDIPLPEAPGGGSYLAYRHEQGRRFLFDPAIGGRASAQFAAWDAVSREDVVETAEAIVSGRLRLFSHHWVDVGTAPDWHRNALSGERPPSDRHWSEIGDFGAGDIKVVWEPSRFGFTFDLARAYWRTGDDRYAARWWGLVERWSEANPPNAGPNWKCGQETSLRVLAWCFGLHAFLYANATTDERVRFLARMIAFSGARVEATLDYALSQQNNHGVSEGMGLFTIGLLFPEFAASARWERVGRTVLERLAHELIYDDGGFSQHSINYHRLMLDDYLWSICLARSCGMPLSDALVQRIDAAGAWLEAVVDPVTGHAPNWGPNDGARILPLSSTGYGDMRPTIQATAALTGRPLPNDVGPWDEVLFWLGLSDRGSERSPAARPSARLPQSGVVVLRSSDGMAFGHAGSFQHRPAHADLLHVDIWWRGRNIAQDPGTYSYNAPAPFSGGLAETRHHNTATLEGREQMERAGRFLWIDWPRAGWGDINSRQGVTWVEGWHDGYARLPVSAKHRRGIANAGEQWIIVDEITSAGPLDVRLHWLLLDAQHELLADSDRATVSLDFDGQPYSVTVGAIGAVISAQAARSDGASASGWVSRHYMERLAAMSLSVDVHKETPRQLIWTVFSPGPVDVHVECGRIRVSRNGEEARLELGHDVAGPLIKDVTAPAAPLTNRG